MRKLLEYKYAFVDQSHYIEVLKAVKKLFKEIDNTLIKAQKDIVLLRDKKFIFGGQENIINYMIETLDILLKSDVARSWMCK